MKSFTLLLLLAANSFASPIIFDGEKTKFQTLLDAYLQAQSPADYADFSDKPAPKHCILIDFKSPDAVTNTNVVTKQIIITPGTPDRVIPAQPANGPLLPATPERKIPGTPAVTQPVVVLGGNFVATMDQAKMKSFSTAINATDLVTIVKSGFYSDEKRETQISIRKKDGYFPFILEYAPYKEKMPAMVGYCY